MTWHAYEHKECESRSGGYYCHWFRTLGHSARDSYLRAASIIRRYRRDLLAMCARTKVASAAAPIHAR